MKVKLEACGRSAFSDEAVVCAVGVAEEKSTFRGVRLKSAQLAGRFFFND